MPLFVTNALDSEELPLYGDGRQTRDWLRRGLRRCHRGRSSARAGRARSTTSGAGDQRENLEEWRAESSIDGGRRIPATARRGPPRPRPPLCLELVKARKARLAPRARLRGGLADTVAWYRDRRAWWEQLRSDDYRGTTGANTTSAWPGPRKLSCLRACWSCSCFPGWPRGIRVGAPAPSPRLDERLPSVVGRIGLVDVAAAAKGSCTPARRGAARSRSHPGASVRSPRPWLPGFVVELAAATAGRRRRGCGRRACSVAVTSVVAVVPCWVRVTSSVTTDCVALLFVPGRRYS